MAEQHLFLSDKRISKFTSYHEYIGLLYHNLLTMIKNKTPAVASRIHRYAV
jgi:hypothetical protein